MARTPPIPSKALRRAASGYTLLEALTVMAIILATTSMALPAFAKALERQRAAASLHAIAAQFAIARSTAITRRAHVSVCPSRGDGTCRSDWDWSEGWLMYLDPGRKGQPARGADILRNERAPAPRSLVILSSSGRRAVRFQPNGKTGGSNITVRVCQEDRLLGSVMVNNLGRVRSERPRDTRACNH